MAAKRLRSVALAIGAAWACWWVSFAVAEAFVAHRQFTAALGFLVLMFGAVVLAWKWPVAGAALFLAEGLASIVVYSPMWWHRFHLGGTLLMFAWMPLPPIAAGALLLLSRRYAHTGHPAAA
ncbi:MAG TPA: hypothetical protein VMG35_18045 [Bryobacteraceae bacterium]|nr:hypothetical protein [Bryobacteraceae bacterium]